MSAVRVVSGFLLYSSGAIPRGRKIMMRFIKTLSAAVLCAAVLVVPVLVVAADTKVVSGTGRSDSNQASACSKAKRSARQSTGWTIVAMGSCDCAQSNSGRWVCTVDATAQKD